MSKITNNKPDYFSITWEFTTTCNYACWYCIDSLHDGKYRWPDLKKSIDFYNNLSQHHENIYLSLLGGEPTLWPDLINFIKYRPKNIICDVVTNASRSSLWWKKASQYLESVCISFHPDTADPDHVINIIKILADSPVKNIHMWILASEKSIDKCFYLYDKVIELNLPINMSPKTIYNMGQKHPQHVIDYNNNNKKVLEFINKPKFTNCQFDISQFKATTGYLDNQPINIPVMVANKENTFLGWNCTIGTKRLNIISNGDIFKGTCRIGGKVGNIYDGTYLPSFDTEKCTKKFCTCIEEIRLEKWTD